MEEMKDYEKDNGKRQAGGMGIEMDQKISRMVALDLYP